MSGTASGPTTLATAAGAATGIRSFDDLLGALKKRHDDFHAAGARVSDHGLESALAEPCTHAQARMVFDAARRGRAELAAANLLDGHPREELDVAFTAACLENLALPYTRTWWGMLVGR